MLALEIEGLRHGHGQEGGKEGLGNRGQWRTLRGIGEVNSNHCALRSALKKQMNKGLLVDCASG
jgi:hypothetical protein